MRQQLIRRLVSPRLPCLPSAVVPTGRFLARSGSLPRPFHASALALKQVARDPIAERRKQEESEFYDEEDLPETQGKLGKLIRDSIRATGPIPISRYMQFCLGHPIEGYYTRDRTSEPAAPSLNFDSTQSTTPTTPIIPHRRQSDVFGRKGDFITSPEISQVFGELVAVWLVMQWMEQGSPKKVRIFELGPGRGTLMDDILRTLHALPTFPTSAIAGVHLVETSEPLRKQQEEKIGARIRTFGGHGDHVELKWSDRLEDVPKDPSVFNMIVAHEFFDALPINVFQKTENGFREVYVNLAGDVKNPEAESSPHGLTLGLAREATTLSNILPATSPRYLGIPVGERVEISPESWQVMRSLGEVVSGGKDVKDGGAGGAALVIDYGQDGASSNSFRAFRNHEIVHVFDDPGSADLTANVDFAYMKEALTGTAHGPITQRDFLVSLGLGPRLDKLLKAAKSLERKQEIASAARRLVDSEGMGTEYKFLAVTPSSRAAASERGGGEEAGKEVYPFGKGV